MQTLTFFEPVGQEVVSGPVLQGLFAEEGFQVLLPGVGVQSPEELLHRVQSRDGLVQVVPGGGARGCQRRPKAIVLHGGKGSKDVARSHLVWKTLNIRSLLSSFKGRGQRPL